MPESQTSPIRIERLMGDLEELARFGRRGIGTGIDRPAFSPQYQDTIGWLSENLRSAGASVRVDAAGNLIGRLGPATGPAVVCGSHVDSVPGGGRYDGTLGVLAGLEALRCMHERAEPMQRALEVVAFADEEGAYLSLMGSRAMTGNLCVGDLEGCTARDGTRLTEAMATFDLDPGRIGDAARPAEDVSAYVELHIEQGPVLESSGADIGVVTSIVGLHTSEWCFTGEASHAGTTPVGQRCDAFRAAAETVAQAYEALERDFGVDRHRLNYGVVDVHPGAPNVVPDTVHLTQEIRAIEEHAIDAVWDMTREIAQRVSLARNVDVGSKLLWRDAAAAMSGRVISHVERACLAAGYASMRLPSGAGHDAQAMARFCDAGMIFVPSAHGVSHHCDEHTSEDQIRKGAEILYESLRSLIQSDEE